MKTKAYRRRPNVLLTCIDGKSAKLAFNALLIKNGQNQYNSNAYMVRETNTLICFNRSIGLETMRQGKNVRIHIQGNLT